MNADLLKPSSDVFYLRGTTGERVLATVAGLSAFAKCMAISCKPSSTKIAQLSVSHISYTLCLRQTDVPPTYCNHQFRRDKAHGMGCTLVAC